MIEGGIIVNLNHAINKELDRDARFYRRASRSSGRRSVSELRGGMEGWNMLGLATA